MFILNHQDPAPLYKQLYLQIREQVLSGDLPPDSRLPSVRDLAAELSTSRNTVEAAYQELYAEGYIYSRQRSGYFVSPLDQDVASKSLPHKPRKQSSLPKPPSYLYDFHPARLDPASFPRALWRKSFLDCLRDGSSELTQYGDLQGEWGLRCNIQGYLERSRGVVCEPDQIVICPGLQHSLDIVAHLLKECHSSIAVENPGYHLPRAVFRNNSFTVVPVAIGPNGLDPETLKASGSTITYVTPSHQLPMGCVIPVGNRLKLIEWAESGRNFIIEDDYDSELRYQGKPIPSLQGLRPNGNIIYLGTFSKILSPALRLSYLVLPPSLLAPYRLLFADYFPTVSLLEQNTLAKFMELGHWERHVRRMRIIYRQKHDTVLKVIAHSFGRKATVLGQGAGLHVVIRLEADNPGEAEIIQRAERNGIRLFPMSHFHVADEPDSTNLLLGFGGSTNSELEKGISLLAQICF